MKQTDPYLNPSFSFGNRLLRFCWMFIYALLFRPSPRPCHGWRRFLLRCFGAKMARNTKVYSTARVWAPWNLTCEEAAVVAEDAIVYNPKPMRLGSHAIISQMAYLCGATHDYEDPAFPLIAFPTTVGDYAWVCAKAVVQPGVNVGEGAVLGLGSIATRDLEPWTVYAGTPARKIKTRVLRQESDRVGI